MQEITKDFRIKDLMEMHADVAFNDSYQLRLSSKKLRSGKCQVKFFASVKERKDLYGYVLVDSEQTLKDVVVGIKERLCEIRYTRDFHHIHLYSIGKTRRNDLNFIIFDQ